MDQIKEQLGKVKPYAFWIVCTVILLMTLGTWYMATGTLHQQKEEYEGKIKTAGTTLQGIETKASDHPNPESTKGMDKLINAYGREIAAGWDAQYKRQEGVLVWPRSFDEDFQLAVKDLRPIEKVPVKTPVNLTIGDSLRRRYRDFIEDELPKLAETIGAKWHARSDGTTATTPPGARLGADGRPLEEVDRSIVLWNPENQRDLLMSHYGFTAMANDPSTLDVLYAQEDLWVLQNLMDIIKKTNDTAVARHDAVVKQIEFIRIGKSALGNAGQVMYVGSGTAPDPSGRESPYGQPPAGGIQPGVTPAPAAPVTPGSPAVIVPPPSPTTDPNFNARDPANWRYVDKNNFPLAGFQLRTALTAPTPENALLTVAKRMPIRIRLEINQRQLNKLLAEFGNAALPVEIRQIRINREPAAVGSLEGFFSQGGGGAGPGGAMPGGFRSGGGEGGGNSFAGPGPSRSPYPGGGEGGFGGFSQPGASGSGSLTRDATVDTNLIKLELYGIVYLYNPVNNALLGLAPAGGTAQITTPPVTPGG